MKYLDDLVTRRDELTQSMRGIIDAAGTESRDLNEADQKSLDEMQERTVDLDARIDSVRSVQVAGLEAAKVKAEIAATDDTPEERAVGRVHVTSEEATYSERSDADFFADVVAHRVSHSPAAGERLARHQAEMADEYRAVGTGDFSALVIPTYAVGMAEKAARAGRPFLDLGCDRRTLPSTGQTIEINRITTASTTAIQATQNSSVSSTNMASTTLSVPVVTIAGDQVVSRQAVDRGSNLTQAVVSDLVAAYHTTADQQAISGSGSSGQSKGIYTVLDGGANEVTYTDASPTAAELYPKLADCIQRIQTGSYKQPTHWLMHPRRIGWLVSSVDSTGRPLMVPTQNGASNAYGIGDEGFRYGASGYTLLGLPVISDANVQTDLGAGTEDAIYCVNGTESILWEAPGAPLMLNMQEPNATSLGWTFVVYGFSAYTAERNGAVGHAMITGTGLIAPTF
jgi:HK97 family phage major capsid protein